MKSEAAATQLVHGTSLVATLGRRHTFELDCSGKPPPTINSARTQEGLPCRFAQPEHHPRTVDCRNADAP